VKLLEGLVQKSPERADYWSSLAVAYDAVGNGTAALEAIRKAAEQ
jgi:hypothetical protein